MVGNVEYAVGNSQEAVALRRQLLDMQMSISEANATKETALEELKRIKQQADLTEAARQLQDAEARSQAVRAVGEMAQLAERRVTEAEEQAEAQIREVESYANARVEAAREQANEQVASVQQQTEEVANAQRRLHEAEARYYPCEISPVLSLGSC